VLHLCNSEGTRITAHGASTPPDEKTVRFMRIFPKVSYKAAP